MPRGCWRPFERSARSHRDKRGRTIGVPTANLQLETDLACTCGGVYYCTTYQPPQGWWTRLRVNASGRRSRGPCCASRHTCSTGTATSTTAMSLRFHDRLRDERRFTGGDELVAQIHRDVLAARSIAATR
ncbi:MAG: riboflavin kinase [Chloroflexia bacterium]